MPIALFFCLFLFSFFVFKPLDFSFVFSVNLSVCRSVCAVPVVCQLYFYVHRWELSNWRRKREGRALNSISRTKKTGQLLSSSSAVCVWTKRQCRYFKEGENTNKKSNGWQIEWNEMEGVVRFTCSKKKSRRQCNGSAAAAAAARWWRRR